MFARLMFAIAYASAIPAFGWVVGARARLDLFGTDRAAREFAQACGFTPIGDGPCARISRIELLQSVSLWSGAILIAALLAVVLAARSAGPDRRRNAAIFPTLAPLTTTAVAIAVGLQGLVLTWAIATLGAHPFAVWAVGFLAVIVVVTLIAALRAAETDQPAGVPARVLGPRDAPKLWAFIDQIAERLDASRPRNVIVGLEPTFFATAAPIATPDREQPLSGETLYLSAPLMRLLTRDELAAVVAHELGHFRGDDTRYSLKFSPIYRRLGLAIIALEGGDGVVENPLAWPAHAVLTLMHDAFAINERAISRDREHVADDAALSVAGARALGTSLAKVAVFAPLWSKIRQDNVERIEQGKLARNLSRTFVDAARYDVSHRQIAAVLGQVLEARLPHPTDSHPPLAERFREIGFDATSLTLNELTDQGGVGEALFDDLDELERGLTLFEHKAMVGSGVAEAGEPSAVAEERVLSAAYVLAASMVMADGEKQDEEIRIAEEIGARIFPNFDAVRFRETFDQLADLPSFVAAVHILGDILSPRARAQVHQYLAAIAAVDGVVDPGERRLLDEARRIWGVRRRLSPFGGGSLRVRT